MGARIETIAARHLRNPMEVRIPGEDEELTRASVRESILDGDLDGPDAVAFHALRAGTIRGKKVTVRFHEGS